MRRESLAAALHPDLSLRLLHAALTDEGLDPGPALEAAGLPPEIDQLPRWISGHQELRFQQGFVRLTGYRPDLWLRVGRRYRIAAFGRLGLAFMTSRDLRQIIEEPLRMSFSYTSAFTRPIHAGSGIVGQELDLSETPDDLLEFAIYHSVGTILGLYDDLCGAPFPFTSVQLSLPAPPVDLGALFPCPVTYAAERTAWYWEPGAERRPLPHADPRLHEMLIGQLGRELREKVGQDDLVARVTEAVRRLGGTPNLAVAGVAAELGVTPRTLQRRLAERGLTFRGLLDSTRRERAATMLLASRLPIADIAFRLGFADVTGFEHAFRRWTGQTPRQFRLGAARPALAPGEPVETVGADSGEAL